MIQPWAIFASAAAYNSAKSGIQSSAGVDCTGYPLSHADGRVAVPFQEAHEPYLTDPKTYAEVVALGFGTIDPQEWLASR